MISAPVRYIPAEAGGLISLVQASGIDFSVYAPNPSGVTAIGVQLHDVIEFDQPPTKDEFSTRNIQIYPRPTHRKVHDLFELLHAVCQGEIWTNFIHPDASPYSGATAYVGPSGLFTTDSSFGGDIAGLFISELRSDPRDVYIEGGGFYRQQVERLSDGTYRTISVGCPRKTVRTPGFAGIKLEIEYGTGGNS
jgi:hypothetical protein